MRKLQKRIHITEYKYIITLTQIIENKENTTKNYAYVSIVTSENYLVGLEAMYLSLKQTKTKIPLYVMLHQSLVDKNQKIVEILKSEGMHIIEYDKSVSIPEELSSNNTKQGDLR